MPPGSQIIALVGSHDEGLGFSIPFQVLARCRGRVVVGHLPTDAKIGVEAGCRDLGKFIPPLIVRWCHIAPMVLISHIDI